MHIDSEECVYPLVPPGFLTNHFPLCDKGLTACAPCSICRIDAAWVIFERRTVENGIGIERTSGVLLVQAEEIGFVEVGGADVAAWLTAVLVVDGCDVCEGVGWASCGADGGG